MAIGHFMMAFEHLFLFALGFLILGNGAFKPNISTQVGALYAPGDRRRDRAFSIFYVGINLGAFLAPLVCGTLGEELGWHYGFAAAGVGMTTGLVIYLLATPALPKESFAKRATAQQPLDRAAWQSIVALLLLFVPVSLFWGIYEQQGNTIVLWASELHRPPSVRLGHSGDLVPGAQPVHDLRLHAVHRFAVAPPGRARTVDRRQDGDRLFSRRRRLSRLWSPPRVYAGGAQASWLWLFGYFFVLTVGELYLSPTSLSLVTKVAPAQFALDDDGRVARDQFHRRISRRLSRHVLVQP